MSTRATARILVVEDVPTIAEAIASHLSDAGYDVDIVHDGATAASTDIGRYAAVTLDAMLPRMSGFEVCRRWRTSSSIPVLMVTALRDPNDEAEAFAAGVDDFMTKPVAATELIRRIGALVRRSMSDHRPDGTQRRVGDLELDLVKRNVEVDGRLVRLTPVECSLLGLLAGEPGRTFSREEISFHLYGSTFVGDSRSCDVHVKNLRRKIEHDPMRPDRILTERGAGTCSTTRR